MCDARNYENVKILLELFAVIQIKAYFKNKKDFRRRHYAPRHSILYPMTRQTE